MRKIDLADFGSSSQKLQQEDLKGDFAILTIASLEPRTVPDREAKGGQRSVLLLRFEETGDKALWLNWVTEIKMVMAQFGDDYDAWEGQKLPVERVTREYKGQQFKKVAIADAAKWGDMFKQAAVEWRPIG
jgi:hypothetical protein